MNKATKILGIVIFSLSLIAMTIIFFSTTGPFQFLSLFGFVVLLSAGISFFNDTPSPEKYDYIFDEKDFDNP